MLPIAKKVITPSTQKHIFFSYLLAILRQHTMYQRISLYYEKEKRLDHSLPLATDTDWYT